MARLLSHAFVLLAVLTVMVTCMPYPGKSGGGHTHFVIHVPHLIEKHHHTHVKKIYIPVKSGGDDYKIETHVEDGW